MDFPRYRYIFAVLIPLFLYAGAGAVSAQDATDEALFQRARTEFLQEKYVAARLDLNELISRYPDSPNIETARMLLAKTFFRLGDFGNAQSVATYLQESPGNPYDEWADYMIAACRYRLGDTDAAAEILVRLAGTTSDTRLRDHALRAIRTDILNAANPAMVNDLLGRYNISMVDVNAADPSAEQPAQFLPPAEEWVPGTPLKIGLLAPLSGMNAAMGTDLYRGVQAALQNHREVDGITIELVVKDTETDLITTVLRTRELIQEGVVAIIGPVYGEYSIAAAIEAQHAGIPFVSPTVSTEGLTEIGRNIFQLNLTPSLQADALARFAADSLVFKDTAVIATNDDWGETVRDTYTSTFTRLGGVVLETGVIEPGARVYNYDDILTRIRNSAPELPALGDSMIVIDSGGAYPDTLVVYHDFSLEEDGPRYPPIDTIDCILVSAFAEDVRKVARQIREYGINTVLIGDTGWEWDVLADEECVNGSYMISSVGDLSGVIGSRYFSDDYDSVNSRLGNSYSRRGYDACAVILHCLARGARTPDTVSAALESVRNFHGISSRITIDPETHQNTAVDFVQIRNGRLVKFNRMSLYEMSNYPSFFDE